MPRIFRYAFVIECQGEGEADLTQVEELLDLSMQELVYDDQFVTALDEKESISIQVLKLDR
jgi:hypothetical protein